MKKTFITIITTAVVTLLIIIGIYFCYTKIINKNDNTNSIIEKNNLKNNESQTADNTNMLTENFKYKVLSKINFENDECIAIGYIEKGKEEQIKEKYFNTNNEYESLTTVFEGDEYQFIVIPQKTDATLKIWKYNISEDGELFFDKLLAKAKGIPLLIETQCTEVFPRVGIEYENCDTKFIVPLMISGMDGKLIFSDYKNLIKDISIY